MTLLELKNISKIYGEGDSKFIALKKINLTINQGEFVAIMGPSGSGKSTLMHILGALDTPTEGEYYLENNLVSSMSDDDLAEIRNKKIGFVFQSFNLLSRTSVLDNVIRPMIYGGIARNLREKRALELLKMVGLESKKNNLSNQLSGGQIQRVAIARALIMNPSIILADEPTGNLDTKSSHAIMDFLVQLNKDGKTVIVITHEQDIAGYAKRIILIRDGNIIEDIKGT